MSQTGGFQTSIADVEKAPSPHSVCHGHCQCHGHPPSPVGPEWAALALHPPAPHNQRHRQAGLETCVCSGKENGTENFGASGLCPAPGPAHSVPLSPWQHSARMAVCSSWEGSAGRRAQSPRLTGTAPASGSRSARRRDGGWAAAPKGRGTRRTLPPAHRPGAAAASRSVAHTRRQERAPDPEVVPED